MGSAAYAESFFTGFQLAAGAMVFAVALAVVFGRFVTGDEGLAGLLVRGGLLAAIGVAAISRFGTVWYWLMLPLALAPLVEAQIGEGLAGPWLNRQRQRRLGEAAAAAAEQPGNAVIRLGFARALLETRQVEAGMRELREAAARAPEDSREMIEEMAREVEAELVRSCPRCGLLNAVSARACGRCFCALTEAPSVRMLVALVRPLRGLLPRRG